MLTPMIIARGLGSIVHGEEKDVLFFVSHLIPRLFCS